MAANVETLDSLASDIAKFATAITSHLEAHNLPAPTFAADSPSAYPTGPEIDGPRLMLISTLHKMFHLAMGPKDWTLIQPVLMQHDLNTLNVLNQFDFWSAVPIDGSASYAAVAAHTRLPEPIVRRILRHAITMHLFSEAPSATAEEVMHSATSAHIAGDRVKTSWLAHNLEEVSPAVTRLPEALRRFNIGKHTPAQDLHETGFALEFAAEAGEKGGFWDYLAKDESGVRTRRFAEAMQAVPSGMGLDMVKLLSSGFDWAGLGDAMVVDVGGSSGHDAAVLASQYPNLRVIVQDLPSVEPAFNAYVASGPTTAVASRLTFQPHDFFALQPIAADVYFLKMILHDWSDKHAMRILRALLPALKPSSRIVLCEGVAPPEGAPLPLQVKRTISAADLQMLVTFNSKERSEAEWRDLVVKADQRLELANVYSTPGSAWAILEIVFKG